MQAFTSDGQQLWQTALNSGYAGLSVPDGFGGMIVSTACDGPNSIPLTLNDINSQGGSNWQAQITSSTPGVCPPATPKIAIGQDGAVVVANVTQVSPPLAILDGQTGAALSLPAIPASTFINSFGEPTTCDCLSILGQPIVDSDGSTYVEYEVRTVQFWSTGASTTNSSALYLLKLAPDYTTATTLQLTSATLADVFPSTIIPDGNGGVLATWTVVDSFDPNTNTTPFAPQPYQAAYVSGGAIAATYQLPNSPTGQLPYGADHLPLAPQLVLGENGTAFASYGSNVTSFQLPSGSPNWNWPAPAQSALSLVAALTNGSLAGKLTDQTGSDRVFTFDSNGSPTDEGISGNGINAGWGAQLFTINGEFGYSMVNFASSAWASPRGNPGGTATSVLNVGNYESVPLFALPFQPKKVIKCPAGDNSTAQVALGSGVSTKYNALVAQQYQQAVAALLASGALNTQTSQCGEFFNSDSRLAPYYSQLQSAVSRQLAYDGLQSTISMYSAGTWTQKQVSDPTSRLQLLNTPVCSVFRGPSGWSGDVALAQTQPPQTDVYIYTGKEALKNLTQSTVLHEALHNLTGLNDDNLYNLLTRQLAINLHPTSIINDVLVQSGCAAQ